MKSISLRLQKETLKEAESLLDLFDGISMGCNLQILFCASLKFHSIARLCNEILPYTKRNLASFRSISYRRTSLLTILDIDRNQYFNDAIKFYNQHKKRIILIEQLKRESAIVAEDSMTVLHEFEQISNDL